MISAVSRCLEHDAVGLVDQNINHQHHGALASGPSVADEQREIARSLPPRGSYRIDDRRRTTASRSDLFEGPRSCAGQQLTLKRMIGTAETAALEMASAAAQALLPTLRALSNSDAFRDAREAMGCACAEVGTEQALLLSGRDRSTMLTRNTARQHHFP